MGTLTRGWKPVWLGTAMGLLLGFAGGTGAGLVADREPVGAAVPSITPSPSPTPSAPASHSPAPTSAPKPKASVAAPRSTAGPAQPSPTCGSASARLVRFRVLVEDGLPTTSARFAQDLLSVVCDKRSWIAGGRVRFQYDPAGSLLIALRTPESTERRCKQLVGLSVNSYYSCGSSREVVLNSDRWFGGSRYWPGPVPAYRQMLVNHEVGHAIGQHHRSCAADGSPAPVMMQQSKGMTSNGRTCKPNSWPLASELSTVRR
jgi:uncharacterized protein DUF3152